MNDVPTTHSVAKAIQHLRGLFGRDREAGGLSSGDRAELRRIDLAQPLPPAVWRLLTLDDTEAAITALDAAHDTTRESAERAFALVIQFMAIVGRPGGEGIGAALARTGYAEQRFIALLRARGLADIAQPARQAAQWCRAQNALPRFDDLARFVLDAALKRDAEAQDRAHAIARDYFTNLPRDTRAATGT